MLSLRQLLNPLGKEQYKIDTEQSALNELIYDKIVDGSELIRSLRLIIAPSFLHLRGVIIQPNVGIASKLNIGDIHFDISFSKMEVNAHDIVLEIRRFKIFNPHKKIDLIKLLSHFSPIIKDKILEGFTGKNSPFSMVEKEKSIRFNLEFLLQRITSEVNILGSIQIQNICFERKKVVWYVYSTLMFKGIIDYLGPQYIKVQQVDFAKDAIKLLTDFRFDLS